MTYVIAAPCIDHNDQACLDVCPVDCITADPVHDRKFYIDPEVCIDCGQCASACPNHAVFRADRLPAEWSGFAAVEAEWYRDPDAARGAVQQLATRLGIVA